MKIKFLFCLLLAALAGCGKPGPVSLEEQRFYMAKQQCVQDANNMNPVWQSVYNPDWCDSFTFCMNQYGISDHELNNFWY